MGIITDPISAALTLGNSLIERFLPDPSIQAQAKADLLKAQMNGELTQITAQLQINNTEAASTDPLQHWRGGMGWVCVLAYFYNFVGQPLMSDLYYILYHSALLLRPLDIAPLATLTAGMLGLGGMHVYQQVKNS